MAAGDMINVFDEMFPGNASAFDELKSVLDAKKVTAFVGAGASADLAPTWVAYLSQLVEQGRASGVIDNQDADGLISQAESDPLETASLLEDIFSRSAFRARIGASFQVGDRYGKTHKAIMKLGLKGIVTSNYDDGLANAYADICRKAAIVIPPNDKQSLIRWERQEFEYDGRLPIIHWHGVANVPNDMVFTGDDYDRYYSDQTKYGFLERLWKNERLVCIGYGFKDPFLNRVAEGALRLMETDVRHFALIGVRQEDSITPLARKSFSRKFRLSPIFYPVITDPVTKKQDHSALTELLDLLSIDDAGTGHPASNGERFKAKAVSDIVAEKDRPEQKATKEFKANLFETPRGTTLYVDPTLVQVESNGDHIEASESLTLSEVVDSKDSFIILASAEYGATTTAKKVVSDIALLGNVSVYRLAPSLPNFQRKLAQEVGFKREDAKARSLILDDFDIQLHERLLKEIISLKVFDRYIIFTKRAEYGLGNIGLDIEPKIHFKPLKLVSLTRADIRILASQMYETGDDMVISHAVEKAYNDLLELCIPLTPSNIIMYLSIIHKEGDFLPLSRLQIIERYINDLLKKPSDLYQESFNVKNKVDVVSAFVFSLHQASKTVFNEQEWFRFTTEYMRESIIAFDEASLLADMLSSRIVLKVGISYVFKYRLFYSYFLGRFVANRPKILAEFIKDDAYLSIYGLVEIISGVSVDNGSLVEDIVSKLEKSLDLFEAQYHIADFKPFDDILWTQPKDEEDRLWKPIALKLEEGPKSSAEIDDLKRSLVSEKRTEEQSVVIRNFDTYEREIIDYQTTLTLALNNSDTLDGKMKLRAVKAIYAALQVMMQSGVLLAPAIADKKVIVWKGVAFINEMEQRGDDSQIYAAKIAFSIPRAVSILASDLMGTKKLGEIYRRLEEDEGLSMFARLLNYNLILRSKPKNWKNLALTRIEKTNRFSMYLRFSLEATDRNFSEEINTHSDRLNLKALIATIRAKRLYNKERPEPKLVSKLMLTIDKQDLIDKAAKQVVGSVEMTDSAYAPGDTFVTH